MAYANIDKCGLYQDNFRNWSRKSQSDKTWGKFKAHFARAFKETRRSSRTSRTKGYVAHVHAAQTNAELFTDKQQYPTLALANLATATQADKTSVALLTKTISELSGQVALLTAKLDTVQAETARNSNDFFNMNSPANGAIRLNTIYSYLLLTTSSVEVINLCVFCISLCYSAPDTVQEYSFHKNSGHNTRRDEQRPGSGKERFPGMRFPVDSRQEKKLKISGRLVELLYSGEIQVPQNNDRGIQAPG